MTDDLQARRTFFNEHGYLLVPGVVPASEARRLAALADTLTAHAAEVGLGEPWFSILHPKLKGHHELALVNAIGDEAVLGFCRRLTGYDFKIGWTYQLVLNRGGSPWHHDSLWARREIFTGGYTFDHWKQEIPFPQLTVRVALVDDDTAWFVPGSHRRARSAAEEDVVGRKVFDPGLAGCQHLPLAAGDMLMYNRTILHGGTVVAPGGRRRTLYWTWARHDRPDPLYDNDAPIPEAIRGAIHPGLLEIDARSPQAS